MSRQELLTHYLDLEIFIHMEKVSKKWQEKIHEYMHIILRLISEMDSAMGHKNWKIEKL